MKGLGFSFGCMNSVKGDSFYHECSAKADTNPFMYLLFFSVKLYLRFLRDNLLEKCWPGHFCNWQWEDSGPFQ